MIQNLNLLQIEFSDIITVIYSLSLCAMIYDHLEEYTFMYQDRPQYN